jgi:hypothetical protein
MRKLACAVLVVAAAPSLFAANADKAVMKTVFGAASHVNHLHGVAPAVVRSKTLGGADSFASQWIVKVRGDVIGRELADSYARENMKQEDVNDYFPKLVKTVEADAPYDWSAIGDEFPAANALMVFSRPAFDSLGSVAFVRADVIPKKGTATTTFYELDHQPDDSWKIDHMAVVTYDSSRRSDVHLSAR